MAKTVRSKKVKGKRLVVKGAEMIAKAIHVSNNDVAAKTTSEPGIDLYLSAIARERFPIGPEFKNTERFELNKFWRQAVDNAEKEGLEPAIIHSRNHGEILITMRLRFYLKDRETILALKGEVVGE